MLYSKLPEYSQQEIKAMLDTHSDKTTQVLLSVGEYCKDYDVALNVILDQFCASCDDEIRACCALSFSYLARRFRKMDKDVITILKKELSRNVMWQGRIQDAIDDIEVFCNI